MKVLLTSGGRDNTDCVTSHMGVLSGVGALQFLARLWLSNVLRMHLSQLCLLRLAGFFIMLGTVGWRACLLFVR